MFLYFNFDFRFGPIFLCGAHFLVVIAPNVNSSIIRMLARQLVVLFIAGPRVQKASKKAAALDDDSDSGSDYEQVDEDEGPKAKSRTLPMKMQSSMNMLMCVSICSSD